MGIVNEMPNKKKDKPLISILERIHLNLIQTINNPPVGLIIHKIYPHISDFDASTNILHSTYETYAYINTVVTHRELYPAQNLQSLLQLTKTGKAIGVVRRLNYKFSVVIYIRTDSVAIDTNFEIGAYFTDKNRVLKTTTLKYGVNTAYVVFNKALDNCYIMFRGRSGTVPANGKIELLYYGIYLDSS